MKLRLLEPGVSANTVLNSSIGTIYSFSTYLFNCLFVLLWAYRYLFYFLGYKCFAQIVPALAKFFQLWKLFQVTSCVPLLENCI